VREELRPLRPLEDDPDAKNQEERALRSVRPSDMANHLKYQFKVRDYLVLYLL
ncbi:unnamed protein product, partial [Durusdinium trenchii]